MRDKFKYMHSLSQSEKEDLFKDATIVFDTNVLLNLYRYSNNTRESVIDVIENYKERIWIPYQVGLEFMKNRYKVIDESKKRIEKLREHKKTLITNLKALLSMQKDDKEISEIDGYIENWITKVSDQFIIVNGFFR